MLNIFHKIGNWIFDSQKLELIDLEIWRRFFIRLMLLLFVFLLPLSMVVTFPIFIKEGFYRLVILDIVILILAIISLFSKVSSYKFHGFIWLVILYTMTITFFVSLGPHYVRPAWLVLCAVMAVLIFGKKAALLTTLINALMLMGFYWLIGPENPAWAPEYSIAFNKWVMFVVNISFLTLGASIPIGFLLNKLDRSLNKEREGRQKVSEESRKLHSTIVQLQDEINLRKKLENSLIHTKKMETIGILSGGVAHDFYNILTSMMGYTELALLDLPVGSKIEQDLKKVLNAGELAKDLINQILKFGRKFDEELQIFSANKIVSDSIKLIRASLPSTIEIHQQINSDSVNIKGNPTQIQQVLLNLCVNAAYAMRDKGGILKISLSTVDVQHQKGKKHPKINPGSYIMLNVSDTGRGMPSEMLKKIFDPFFTTKEKGAGTGLGLSIVNNIVRSHGGTITVQSTPGKGSEFYVYLPRVENVVTI